MLSFPVVSVSFLFFPSPILLFMFNEDTEPAGTRKRAGASFVLCVSVYVCVKQFHGHLSCTVNFALLHFKWWARAWPAVIK